MKTPQHLSLLLAALALAAVPLHAATATVNGIAWTYTVLNGAAMVGGRPESLPSRVCRPRAGAVERCNL